MCKQRSKEHRVPLRVRAKSSSFLNLSVTNDICNNCLIADVPAIVGSIDIVMGEVDRLRGGAVMEFRTISGPKTLPLPRVQRGGRGFFLGGAFQAVLDPLVEGLVLTPKHCVTFPLVLQPAVAAGIADGFTEALNEGKRFCSARLEPDSLKYHDVDTTDEGSRKLARYFVRDQLWAGASPISLRVGWKTAGVIELTRAYRSTSAPDTLPILADALEEAGCDLAFLLEHLRQCPDHGARCWVVDLLLGEE